MDYNVLTYKEYVRMMTREVDAGKTRDSIDVTFRALKNTEQCGQIFSHFIEDNSWAETYYEKLERIVDLFEIRELGHSDVNIFPFDDLTEEVYPEFVGICQDETTFDDIMVATNSQCKKMIDKYDKKNDNVIDKTILILTDKWDAPRFREKYAPDFINYAYNHNIVFVILLVTDMGILRIPFIPSDRTELCDRRRCRVEALKYKKRDKNALTKLQKFDGCIYEVHENLPAFRHKASFRFTVDFKKMLYICEDLNKSDSQEQGKIPRSVLNRFAQRVIDISKKTGPIPGPGYTEDYSRPSSYTFRIVDIFGKHFEWLDGQDNPAGEKLATALKTLLDASGCYHTF